MITYGEYGPEKNMVHEFIRATWKIPVLLHGTEPRHLFCWGYELWLAPGLTIDDGGSVDLIATDDTGAVWLIEAKLHSNPELCQNLWNKQVIRYRKALSDMPPDIWVPQTRRYLIGASLNAPVPEFLRSGCDSLEKCFIAWCRHRGESLPEEKGRKLYRMTEAAIAGEEIIGVVLADIMRQDVWEARPRDGHRYGYLAMSGTGEDLHAVALLDSVESALQLPANGLETGKRLWTDLIREKRGEPPTIGSIRSIISDACVEQYDMILDRLKEMGWNGRFKTGQKSYTIWLPTVHGVEIGLMLGLVDLDGQFSSLKHKLPGEGAFKCDINIKPFRHHQEKRAIGMDIAQQLIKTANYRGRGVGERLKIRHLAPLEQEEWSWILHHWVTEVHRDFTGLDQDKKDIVAAMNIVASIVLPEKPEASLYLSDDKQRDHKYQRNESSISETQLQGEKAFSIINVTTTNLGNFGLYRGEVHLLGQDGKKYLLSNFINEIQEFETVTVDLQDKQGRGIHFGDIVGEKLPGILNPRIVKDKMKKLLIEELIKQDYVSIDGNTIYRFSRVAGLHW